MDLTICIPTHAIKTETRGIYNGVHNTVPSAPSTRMIEKIIDNIGQTSNIDVRKVKIIVGLDKRADRAIDEEYHQNILKLSKEYNLDVSVNESNTDDPIFTAPDNFLKLIGGVKTKYYMFWEHDWIFNRFIDINQILNEMDINKKINYIRFNQFDNNNNRYTQFKTESSSEVSAELDLIPTFRWSNNPYICRTNIFQNWWSNFVYPTTEEGGFVEGPLNVFYEFYASKIGWEKSIEKFGCFVYGKWNDSPLVSHLNGNSWK